MIKRRPFFFLNEAQHSLAERSRFEAVFQSATTIQTHLAHMSLLFSSVIIHLQYSIIHTRFKTGILPGAFHQEGHQGFANSHSQRKNDLL